MTAEAAEVLSLKAPILLISPHFDDAVLSCGRFLSAHPGTVVMTVMGGSPESWTQWRRWDHEKCGIPVGTDVVALRKEEDRQALEVLGSVPKWADVLDLQYCSGPRPNRVRTIREAIGSALDEFEPTACLFPVGIEHFDHQEVRRHSLFTAQHRQGCRWFAYDELPRREREPDHYRRALRQIEAGWTLTPVHLTVDASPVKKLAAVKRYESQLVAIGEEREDFAADLEGEGYWEVSPKS